MARSNWRIGMVGLGALGLPMAVNLHRAGHTLQVHTAVVEPKTTRSSRSAALHQPAAAADNVDVLLLASTMTAL